MKKIKLLLAASAFLLSTVAAMSQNSITEAISRCADYTPLPFRHAYHFGNPLYRPTPLFPYTGGQISSKDFVFKIYPDFQFINFVNSSDHTIDDPFSVSEPSVLAKFNIQSSSNNILCYIHKITQFGDCGVLAIVDKQGKVLDSIDALSMAEKWYARQYSISADCICSVFTFIPDSKESYPIYCERPSDYKDINGRIRRDDYRIDGGKFVLIGTETGKSFLYSGRPLNAREECPNLWDLLEQNK